MLCLSRKKHERIVCKLDLEQLSKLSPDDHQIEIAIVSFGRGQVSVGIEAPPAVKIVRGELTEAA